LTNYEQKQQDAAFIEAGRIGYALGMASVANPYRGKPQFKLWQIGYKRAETAAGGSKALNIKRTYSVDDLEEVQCIWCDDIFLERQRCQKCNPEMIEITMVGIKLMDRSNLAI
jgi:hypothetical protein